jgi:hypothetical protein
MAQMKQKSYHDKEMTPRHFEVGDYVYLKVSPTKGVQRFGVKGNQLRATLDFMKS